MEFALFTAIEEQQIVCFTGKINLLDKLTKEYQGNLYLMDGKIVNAKVGGLSPMKALLKLVTNFQSNSDSIQIIVEPELLSLEKKKIDYPHLVLIKKIEENLRQLEKTDSNRPPDNLKLLIDPAFVIDGAGVSPDEYSLLCTISDYNLVHDIYEHSDMFDHEITETLVNLRKKQALKVIEVK
jgi:hypothetical protein